MMRKTLLAVLAAATLVWAGGSASAAGWTKVGSSTFTAPLGTQGGDVGGMGDYHRIIFNSVVVDPAGNIFATANGQTTGGLTIFKADGSKIDVDPATAGYGGPVTKLVVAGDGNVYGLQNWLEIHWPGPVPVGGPYVPSRILKISAGGAISLIKEYSPVTYAGSPIAWTNRIVGMTVSRASDGGDGNVYWTLGGYDNYTKYHYFWRYNIASGLVEEAPINNHNNGHLENHRMFDLEWVGVDPDDAENQLFAVVSETANATEWRMDPMGWKITNRPEFAKENGLSNPNIPCRDHITATAYDPTWKKLMVCGRSNYSAAGNTGYLTQWGNNAGAPAFFEKDDTGPDPYGDTNWFWIPRFPSTKPANGNESDTPNGGAYWVSALALNPDQGRAWMAFTGDSTYDYEPRGTILTWDMSDLRIVTIGNEGVPEANAYTVGLAFSGGKAYALVCNKDTGQYSLYESYELGPAPIGTLKRQQPGSPVQSDVPKIVTHTQRDGAYFYIEDDNHSAGIKVIPDDDQPSGYVGDRASVSGIIDVVDGEAVIRASSVSIEYTGVEPQPVATAIRSIGGAQTGIQPPTYAYDDRKAPPLKDAARGANTTGLLLRVVGEVYASEPFVGFFLDDGSDYGIWVDYPEEALTDGSIVGVTGVSSVMLDIPTQKGLRTIRPNPYFGAELVRYWEPTP